jgi:hypothetical protein
MVGEVDHKAVPGRVEKVAVGLRSGISRYVPEAGSRSGGAAGGDL